MDLPCIALPKTMFKQNWKIIMIFRKNKTIFE
jgi:hypothetical protein